MSEKISIKKILLACWENGPASAIYNQSYTCEVTHEQADYIENEGLGCERLDDEVDSDSEDYDPEEMENIRLSVEDYIDNNFEGDFFDKVNAGILLENLEKGIVNKKDIEYEIASMLTDICYFFRDFVVMPGDSVVPGTEENPWDNEHTIYLGYIPPPEVSLQDLNPDWTDEEFKLVE